TSGFRDLADEVQVLRKRTADRNLKKLCGLGMNDEGAVRGQESADLILRSSRDLTKQRIGSSRRTGEQMRVLGHARTGILRERQIVAVVKCPIRQVSRFNERRGAWIDRLLIGLCKLIDNGLGIKPCQRFFSKVPRPHYWCET